MMTYHQIIFCDINKCFAWSIVQYGVAIFWNLSVDQEEQLLIHLLRPCMLKPMGDKEINIQQVQLLGDRNLEIMMMGNGNIFTSAYI